MKTNWRFVVENLRRIEIQIALLCQVFDMVTYFAAIKFFGVPIQAEINPLFRADVLQSMVQKGILITLLLLLVSRIPETHKIWFASACIIASAGILGATGNTLAILATNGD